MAPLWQATVHLPCHAVSIQQLQRAVQFSKAIKPTLPNVPNFPSLPAFFESIRHYSLLHHMHFRVFKLFQDQRQHYLLAKTHQMETVVRKSLIPWNTTMHEATAGLKKTYLVMGNNLSPQ